MVHGRLLRNAGSTLAGLALAGCSGFPFHGRNADAPVARDAVVQSVRTVYAEAAAAVGETAPPAASSGTPAAGAGTEAGSGTQTGSKLQAGSDAQAASDGGGEIAIPSNTPAAGRAVSPAAARLEITVRLNDGEPRAVVQSGEETFSAGERVRLLSQNGKVWIGR